jgi:hypothetical protein
MADIKYPDSTPVDEPIRTGTKPQEPGSAIKVEKEPKPLPTPKAVKKASGGSASSRADGIAIKGKTRGTMVMCGGGYAKGKK